MEKHWARTLFWRDLIVHETFLKGVRVSVVLFSACKFNISNLYIVIYLYLLDLQNINLSF